MKKPFWSWVNACGKLGYRVFRKPKWIRTQRDLNPDDQILQMQAESLEERQMLAADLTNVHLFNDDGVDPNDMITSDPRVEYTTTGDSSDYMQGNTKIQFDHHGDGSIDAEVMLYGPNVTDTYDPEYYEPTLDTYSGPFNLRWQVVTIDPMTQSEIYSTGWTDFNYTIGTASQAEIQVVDDGLVDVTSGSGVVNFGSTELNTPVSKTFTIYNWGTADLTIDLNSFAVPAGFSLTSNPAATVAPNQNTTFTIQYDATTSGLSSGTFSFTNNDADEGTYSFDLIGNVATPQPDIEIRLANGRLLENGNGDVDFGTTIDGTPLYKTLVITNHGDLDLTLDVANITIPTGYTVESNPDTTVHAAGGRTYITLKLDAATIGTYTGTFSIPTNDPDDATYSFDLTGEVTDQYTISVSNFGFTNDTGTPGDNSTYDPRLQGWLSGNFQGGTIDVQFDHDGDGVYEGFVNVVNPMETFNYDPRDFDANFVDTIGARSLDYRFVRYDSAGGVQETGDWNTFNFTLEYDPSLGDITIDQFGLAHDTGDGSSGSDTDKVTVAPILTGIINGPFNNGYVKVEFDHVGDGTISGDVQVNSNGEVFLYDPRDFDASLIGFVGAVSISYRLVSFDANDTVVDTGNWTSFSFTMEALPAGEITIDDLALANDTTDGSAGGDTDKITYDPTLMGSGTIPTSLEFTTPIVEFDFDSDGTVDDRVYLQVDNNGEIAFEYLPTELDYGTVDSSARIVYWDPRYSSFLTGSWATLNFTFNPKHAADLSELKLFNDTIGDDGNGGEEDETANDTGSDNITKDPTISGQVDPESGDVAFVKIEFDYDGDGIVDHHGWTNADGSFDHLPDGLAAGVHTIKARATRYDANLDVATYPDLEVKGEWSELTFTLERVAPYSLDEFKLVNDTPSDAGDADDDGITRDRRVTGQIGNGTDLWGVEVQFDYDGDDVIDATTMTDYNGRFYFDPVGIGFGQKTIRARVVANDAYSNEDVYSGWESVTYTIDQPDYQPVYVTDVKLTDGSDNGNGEAFNPVIEGRVMQPWTYPVGASYDAETMAMLHGYGEDSGAAHLNVLIDIDGDNIADESVQTDWDGRFYFAPADWTAGTHSINIMSQSWDYTTDSYGDSAWVNFGFTVLAKTDNPAGIASFEALPGTGNTDSDHVAGIIGKVSNDGSVEGIAVEWDEDGDGVADGVVFTDEDGQFMLTTGPMAFGSQTVKIRAVEWSHLHEDYQESGWSDVTFTLAEDTVNDAPTIVDLSLGNNEGSPTTYDFTTSDPVITGRVLNDGYLHDVWVEIDLDNDGVANHVVKSGEYGFFTFTAEGLDHGNLDIKVRASEDDIATGTLLSGAWVTLSFAHEEFTTSDATISTFGLEEDTLSADGSGTTSDGITTNPNVTGTITNDDGVEGLMVEIDLDSDGIVDATTYTDVDGNFTYTPQQLEAGTHTVQVRTRQLDQDGNAVYSAWSQTTFTLEEAANSELHVNDLELTTDDGTVTDDFVTTDPTINGSVGGTAAGEGIKVQIDTNGDGSFDAEVYTDSNGDFTFTPELKQQYSGIIDNEDELTGIEHGLNSISFRTVETDVYGFESYSQWNTLNFVFHTDPDSAEAQAMKTARDQYDTDLQASRDAHRTSLDNASNDYRSNRQAAKDALETSLKNASDTLKASQDTAYGTYHTDSQTVWAAYFNEINNALSALAASGSNVSYEIKEFFFGNSEKFAAIAPYIPDAEGQPTPPTGMPTWSGPTHDYSQDDIYQAVLQQARAALELRLKNAREAKEAGEVTERQNYNAAILGYEAEYWTGVAAVWAKYYANIPTEYTAGDYAGTIADFEEQIRDIDAKRRQEILAIEAKYAALSAALLGGGPLNQSGPDPVLEKALAKLSRDEELEKNKTNAAADSQINTIREQIVQFKADVKKWFAVEAPISFSDTAIDGSTITVNVSGKLGLYKYLQNKLADLLEHKEHQVSNRGKVYADALADLIHTHDMEVADASRDYSTTVAQAVRDSIFRRQTADPNPWWTYQLELADHALDYYLGDSAMQVDGVIELSYDQSVAYVNANRDHTKAVAGAIRDQNNAISTAKKDRTHAHNESINVYQILKVNEEHARTIARSNEWANLLNDHVAAKLGGNTMDIDGHLDRLAEATYQKACRDIDSHKKLWDVMNDPASTSQDIADAQQVHDIEMAYSAYLYEVDVVGSLDTRDGEISSAHTDHTTNVLDVQLAYLENLADGVTVHDTAIATADHGTPTPTTVDGVQIEISEGGFYVVVAQANATMVTTMVAAEQTWITTTSNADFDYAVGESGLYKTWTIADATSLLTYKTNVMNAWFQSIDLWADALDTHWTAMIKSLASKELQRTLAIAAAELTQATASANAVNTSEVAHATAHKTFIQNDYQEYATLTTDRVGHFVINAKMDHAAFYNRDVDTSQAITNHDKDVADLNHTYQVSIAIENKVLTDGVDDSVWLYRIAVANADYLKVEQDLTTAEHQALIDAAHDQYVINVSNYELARSNALIVTWESNVIGVSNRHVSLATDWKGIRDTFADDWKASQDRLADKLAEENIAHGDNFTDLDETLATDQSGANKDWWTSVSDAVASFGGTVVKHVTQKFDDLTKDFDDFVANQTNKFVTAISNVVDVNSEEWKQRQKATAILEQTRVNDTNTTRETYRAANKINREIRVDANTEGRRVRGAADAVANDSYIGTMAATSETYADALTATMNNYSSDMTAATTKQTVARIKADTQYRVDINEAARDREIGIAAKWRTFVETMSLERVELYKGNIDQATFDATETAESATFASERAKLERQYGIDIAKAKRDRIQAYGVALVAAATDVDLHDTALTAAFNAAEIGFSTGLKNAAVSLTGGLADAAIALTGALNAAATTFIGDERLKLSDMANDLGDAYTTYATGFNAEQWTHFTNNLAEKLADWVSFDTTTNTVASEIGKDNANLKKDWADNYRVTDEAQVTILGDKVRNQRVNLSNAENDKDALRQTHSGAYDTAAGATRKTHDVGATTKDGEFDEDITTAINTQMTKFTAEDGDRLISYASAESARQLDLANKEIAELEAIHAIENNDTLTAQEKSDQIQAVHEEYDIKRAIIQFNYKVATQTADGTWRTGFTTANKNAANDSATAASTWESALAGLAKTFMQGINGCMTTFLSDLGGTNDAHDKAIDGIQADFDKEGVVYKNELDKADLQARTDAFVTLDTAEGLDASQGHAKWVTDQLLAAANAGVGDHAVTRADDDKLVSQGYHDGLISSNLTYRTSVGTASGTRATAVGGAIAGNITDDANDHTDMVSELAAAGQAYTNAVIAAEQVYLQKKAEYDMYLAVGKEFDAVTETVSGDYTQADYDADLAAADATMKADIEAARQVYVAAWGSAVTSYLLDIATNNETHQTTINQAEKDATDAIEDAKKLRDDAVALENKNLIDAKSTNRETASVDEANQIKQQFVDAVTLLGAAATSGQVYEKDKAVAHANRVTGSEGKLKALVGSLNDAIKTYANATSLAFQSYYKTMATHDQTVKQTFNEAHRVAVNSSGNGLQDLANTGFYKTEMPGAPKPGSVTMPSLLEETIEDFFDAFDKPNYHTEMYAVTGQEGLSGEYHWSPDGQNINGRHTRSGPGDLTTQTVRKDPSVGGTDPYVSESVYSQPQTTGDSLANSGNQIGGSGAMLSGGSNKDVKAKLDNGKNGNDDGETVGNIVAAAVVQRLMSTTTPSPYKTILDDIRLTKLPKSDGNPFADKALGDPGSFSSGFSTGYDGSWIDVDGKGENPVTIENYLFNDLSPDAWKNLQDKLQTAFEWRNAETYKRIERETPNTVMPERFVFDGGGVVPLFVDGNTGGIPKHESEFGIHRNTGKGQPERIDSFEPVEEEKPLIEAKRRAVAMRVMAEIMEEKRKAGQRKDFVSAFGESWGNWLAESGDLVEFTFLHLWLVDPRLERFRKEGNHSSFESFAEVIQAPFDIIGLGMIGKSIFKSAKGGLLWFKAPTTAPKGLTALGGSPNRIAASSSEIQSLVSQIKNVAQSSTFVRRAKALGFTDEHLTQIAGRIDRLHASGNVGFIRSGGWIDDTQFLIGRSSAFRNGRIRHELGHLLDDIRSPGLLAEASSSRLSTLRIFGHEMTAFGTQVGRFNPVRPYGSLLTGIHNNYGYAGSVPFIGGSIYVGWFVSNEVSEWVWGN